MQTEAEEPALPYTPSNTGRRARVGYLGFDGVGFNDLWPLFAGLILSLALALKFFIGDGADGSHWLARTVAAALPFSLGFAYLRLLVVGRPRISGATSGPRPSTSGSTSRTRPGVPSLSGPGWSSTRPRPPAPAAPPTCATRSSG
jgi:hypothetical protein